eukprot:755131-Hanusia_phi.AAC.1
MTNELYKECVDAAEAARAQAGAAAPISLCTRQDRGGVRWVSKSLSKMAWRRSVNLARESLKKVCGRVSKGRERVLQPAYKRDVGSYDVVLWLKSVRSLERSQLGVESFKNMRRKHQA